MILAGFGIPTEKIAAVLGISQPTLLKHYESEIAVGAAKVESTLVGNLLRLAKGSDGTALKAIMFALNCRFGWSQYAPHLDAAMGKKEAAVAEAQTAHEGSEWSHLLN